jgi:antitoxin PrlF
MRLTTKGQVTIPQSVRNALGLVPHSEVSFVLRGRTAYLVKARNAPRGRGLALVQRLRGRGDVAMTTDQIMALTRGE